MKDEILQIAQELIIINQRLLSLYERADNINIKPRPNYKPDEVIEKTKEFFSIHIFERTRKKEIVFARHIAAFFLYENCELTHKQIAKIFGYSDHTLSVFAIKKIKSCIKNNHDKTKNAISIISTLLDKTN